MERFISFLTDHFFIVVIVIGLVYTMFFRKSPLENRPPNRMPDFGGGPVIPQRPRQPGRPAGNQSAQPARPFEQPSSSRPIWASDVVPTEAPQPVRVSAPVVAPAATVSAGVQRESPEGALTRDDLTKAVVWAEILGPPRSRRPYRRS